MNGEWLLCPQLDTSIPKRNLSQINIVNFPLSLKAQVHRLKIFQKLPMLYETLWWHHKLAISLSGNEAEPFSTQQIKRVSIHLYTAYFLYNAFIPNFSYTTLYTIVCKKMTSLWFSYTNHIPKPIFTTAFGFVFWKIPNTYQLLWHIPVIYHSSKLLICLRWCQESFWLKNYIILLDT